MAWFGEPGVNSNMTATQAQINQYDDLCAGPTTNSNSIWPTGCPGPGKWGYLSGWVDYMEAGMGQPRTSGHDVDFPYNGSYVNAAGKTCNAAAKIVSGNFWAQQTSVTIGGTTYKWPDYTDATADNWFTYVNGGTAGNANFMASGWTGSVYYFYINLGSPSALAYANDVIANCKQNTTATTQPFDAIASVFQDNTYIGFQSGGWDKWDRYVAGKNFGTGGTGTAFGDPTFGESGTSFVPGTFFNGTAHTRTSRITANDTPITYPSDTSYRTFQTSYLAGLKHADGSAMNVTYNGMLNTDQTLNKNANTRFGVAEELLVGCFGACPSPQPLPYNGPTQAVSKSALGADLGPRSVINNASALYRQVLLPGINTSASYMQLNDQTNKNVDGTTMLGTGIHQMNQLWGYAPIFGMYTDLFPDMMSAFSDMCGFGSSSLSPNCMDVWPFDFIMPSGRITPMPADPSGAGGVQPCGEYSGYHYEGTNTQCTTGGSYDPNILAGGTPGLYRFAFSHLWAFVVTGTAPCTTYDRRQFAACAQDIGPFGLIINGSGSAITITSADILAWFPTIGTSLGHVLVPCTPLITYWGTGSGSPVYAMPQAGTLGYGTAVVCSGSTGQDAPNGGTWDKSHPLSALTANSQKLYDGQALYLVP
jgi:hypothetical protein